MKRETFVKRMMGVGYSRNGANKQAARINRYGISYASRWETISSIRGPLKRTARRAANLMAAVGLAKLGIAAFEPALAAEWEKVPQHHAGLRTHVTLVDEVDTLPSDKLHNLAMRTAAPWPAWPCVIAAIDLANGPDMAAEITVAGGAENAD